MTASERPRRRDWIAGLAAGSALGFALLGVGSRAGMRVIAVAAGQPLAFSISGSVTVVTLGTITGAAIAVIFLSARVLFPTRRWARVLLFWLVCLALTLRGLRPVSVLNTSVFLPLLALHGGLLHAFWCRVHLPRTRSRG